MNFRFGLVVASSLAVAVGGCAAGSSGPAPAGGTPATMGEVLQQGERPRQNEMTETAGEHLDQGYEALEAGSTAEAAASFQQASQAASQAIAADATNPLPWYQGGRAQIGLEDYEAADSMLARAVELRPIYELEILPLREQTWIDLYQEAAPLVNSGDYEGAVPYLEGAHAIYKERPEVMFILGQLLGQLGRYDESVEVLRMALDITHSPEAAETQDSATVASWREQAEQIPVQLAQILVNAQRYDEAIETIRALLEEDPDDIVLGKTLASLYVETDQPDSAAVLYDRLQQRTDLRAVDYYQIGIGLYQLENYVEAAESFEQAALATEKDRDAAEMWARTLSQLHPPSGGETPPEALEEIRRAAQLWADLDPYNRNAYLILAQAAQRSGDVDAARDLVAQIEALPVTFDDLQLRRPTNGGGTVSGSIQNVSADPGSSVTLDVTFFGEDGQPLGTETTTIQLPAQDAKQVFQVEIDTDQQVAGFTYDLQM